MREFFSVEGKFFTVCSKILDMVWLTLLWMVGCIPIITMVTSTAALYHVTVKTIRYDRGKVFEEFKEAYKKNLRQGIVLTLLYASLGAAIVLTDRRLFLQTRSSADAVFFLGVAMIVLTVFYLMNVLWIIPVSSRFANTLGKILQLNLVISVRNLVRTILMALILIAAVALFFLSWPLIFLLPSLLMLIFSYFTEPGMRRYMPRQEEDNGDWRYGFQ